MQNLKMANVTNYRLKLLALNRGKVIVKNCN